MNHLRLLSASVVLAVVTLFCLVGATAWYIGHVADERRLEQVESCQRGNLIRQELNAVIAYLDLDLPPLPRIDCEATVN